MAILENAYVRYLATGEVPKPLGTRHAVTTPFQLFPSKDGYVAVAIMGGGQDQWPVFCSVIGRLDIIDDKRFETGWLRTQNYNVLEPILNEAMKTKSTDEWIKEFEAVSIACGPMNTVDKVAADPQTAVREMIVEVKHPQAGVFKIVNTPIKLSRTPCKVEQASPDLGEHTDKTLKELLSLTQAEIDDLRKSGII
jgi:CoA:oxalate CoA-transferase